MTLRHGRLVAIAALVCFGSGVLIAQAPRVKVGGDVKRPILLKKVAPDCPKEAREKKIVGTVLLDIVIATDGTVLEVEVAKGIHPLLDEAAARAVRQWKFLPTKLNGEPVELILTGVEVTFKVPESGA
jgi:periplasmic protein TonB